MATETKEAPAASAPTAENIEALRKALHACGFKGGTFRIERVTNAAPFDFLSLPPNPPRRATACFEDHSRRWRSLIEILSLLELSADTLPANSEVRIDFDTYRRTRGEFVSLTLPGGWETTIRLAM